MIREFTIRDVRCFAGEQRINIRPLTFLIGENSTGKSTALGCFHTLTTILGPSSDRGRLIDFNQPPYLIGSFPDIARREGNPDQKNQKTISLGLGLETNTQPLERVIFEFEESGSEPFLSMITLLFLGEGKITIEIDRTNNLEQRGSRHFFGGFLIDKADGDVFVIKMLMDELFFFIRNFPFYMEHIIPRGENDDPNINKLRKFLKKKFSYSNNSEQPDVHFHQLFPDMPEVISIAPIRSKPQRTYDPLTETQTPEGSDVPMFLMRLKRTGDKTEKQIQKALADFGKKSGLFNSVSVKPYGKGMNEPFQLEVKIRNISANIQDVGYGVSQLLPILVRIFTVQRPAYFLLQQPEVHLHPRGQAELTSLFITSINERAHKFIIETHSDYMLKRARIEIRNKLINPDDVSLVYFEPDGDQVNVHNISFDEYGNLLNIPNGYEQFFLDESDRFLGFND